jgi:D-cysteine desulfhydrase
VLVHQGKGGGYAVSSAEELDFISRFARDSGIALDPVYSGKALFNFLTKVDEEPETYREQNILFWHTGGALGLYDKSNDLSASASFMEETPCKRLDVYGKGNGVDISAP